MNIKPYMTKVEYIEALERALRDVALASSIEEARLIVALVPQRGGRWRKSSPLSRSELVKAAREIEGETPGTSETPDT